MMRGGRGGEAAGVAEAGAVAARAGTTSSLSLPRRAAPSASPGGGTARTGHRSWARGSRSCCRRRARVAHAAAAGTHDQQVTGAAGHADQDPASVAARSDTPGRRGRRGPVPRGLGGAAADRTSVGSAMQALPGAAEAASAAAPGSPAAPCPAPSTARGTDVHKQDHRDRAIPAAVIVVVFFVAILVAALIWLAAS